MILYRHCDGRYPFLWETSNQPHARWHADGEGPVHYLADTPYGAWAEFLRHEEISDPADIEGIKRAIWAIELSYLPRAIPKLDSDLLTGGPETYKRCQAEARRLKKHRAKGLKAPSAALLSEGATGSIVDNGLNEGLKRDGLVYALFGLRPDLTGWMAADNARPPIFLLERVHPF